MVFSPPPIREEGVQHPSLKTWTLRGLLVLAVVGIFVSLAIVGWIILVRFQINAGVDWAIDHWREFIEPNMFLIAGGIAVGGAVGVGSYWSYRRLKMKVVEEAKEPIIRLLLKEEITEEEAAEKLGVAKSELKDLIKELKEEEVIE